MKDEKRELLAENAKLSESMEIEYLRKENARMKRSWPARKAELEDIHLHDGDVKQTRAPDVQMSGEEKVKKMFEERGIPVKTALEWHGLTGDKS